jgi:hypothetical protein
MCELTDASIAIKEILEDRDHVAQVQDVPTADPQIAQQTTVAVRR